MSKKTLNEANLAALGAERLAALLIEVSTGSAEIKRRLRLELSHNLGPDELAHDVRMRLASIRRSTSRVGWRKRKALIKDLTTQSDMITGKIAPDAPAQAFDLLWQFIELAPSVYERVDDSRGEVGDAFRAALAHFADIAPRALVGPIDLAERTWDALCDNIYGEFDGIITLLAPTLGDVGLERLKQLVQSYAQTPAERPQDHAALQFLRDLRSSSGDFASEQKARLVKASLQEIASVQRDTDGFIAQYSNAEMKRPAVAAQIADLLLSEARAAEAFDVLTGTHPEGDPRWDSAYIRCLLALDRVSEAQDHRCACFCETLDSQILRDYLKLIPDFEDIEAEDQAKAHALAFDDVTASLQFFISWPDLSSAAQLIESRPQELDGKPSELLLPAADALRSRYPLAAVLLWRAIIDRALWEGQSSRYAQAADCIMDCAAADADISDYGRFASHDAYLENLRNQYKHKASFWARVP
ncbi:DUF6880 family protein [Sulfitobacter sp.]|uniref:DUF6880 family protein n=1 Tax=Sulfitobacter sp. TaxID=1903071 RepID=UPI0030031CE8